MKAKDRITAYVSTNASGTMKLPMALIGSAKNPRCFKLKPPCVPYFSQSNAWSDTKTFREWFFHVFLPFVRKQTSDKVILLMDNCGPQGTDLTDLRKQVTILTLPPNCTARHQPMDAGIIAAWKMRYKQELLRRILATFEQRVKLRKAAANWKAGTKGIDQGHDPHLSDACDMVFTSWDAIAAETIARCWLKCDILPPGHEATLISEYGKVTGLRKLGKDSEFELLVSMFKELKMQLPSSDPLSEEILDDVSDDDVIRWANIEDTEDVRESIVNDLMSDIEKDLLVSNTSMNASESENRSSNETEGVESNDCVIPGFEEVISCFKKVEELANKTGIADAVCHLHRAKRALLAAHAHQNRSKKRQTLVNEYFM